MDYSIITEAFTALGTLSMAFIILYLEILRKPKLTINLQRRDGSNHYTHLRDYLEDSEGRTPVFREEKGKKIYLKGKFLELDVKNDGNVPAKGCEAKCQVWKDGKIQPVEPLLLFWSRKRPYARIIRSVML